MNVGWWTDEQMAFCSTPVTIEKLADNYYRLLGRSFFLSCDRHGEHLYPANDSYLEKFSWNSPIEKSNMFIEGF